MERYLTISGLSAGQIAYIRGKEYVVDESGALGIDLEHVFATQKTEGVSKFELEIEEELTQNQCIALYTSWGNSSAIMMGSLAAILEIDKREAKAILTLGEKYGVLSRGYNNTWKMISKVVKDRFLNNVKEIHQGMRGPKLSQDEIMKEVAEQFNFTKHNEQEIVEKLEEIQHVGKLTKKQAYIMSQREKDSNDEYITQEQKEREERLAKEFREAVGDPAAERRKELKAQEKQAKTQTQILPIKKTSGKAQELVKKKPGVAILKNNP